MAIDLVLYLELFSNEQIHKKTSVKCTHPSRHLVRLENTFQSIKTSFRLVDEAYVVNRSYEAKSADEISLLQGSFVTVLEKSYTGWWLVKYDCFPFEHRR